MNWADFDMWGYDINRTCEVNGIEKEDVKIYGNGKDIDAELILEFPNGFKIIKSI